MFHGHIRKSKTGSLSKHLENQVLGGIHGVLKAARIAEEAYQFTKDSVCRLCDVLDLAKVPHNQGPIECPEKFGSEVCPTNDCSGIGVGKLHILHFPPV